MTLCVCLFVFVCVFSYFCFALLQMHLKRFVCLVFVFFCIQSRSLLSFSPFIFSILICIYFFVAFCVLFPPFFYHFVSHSSYIHPKRDAFFDLFQGFFVQNGSISFVCMYGALEIDLLFAMKDCMMSVYRYRIASFLLFIVSFAHYYKLHNKKKKKPKKRLVKEEDEGLSHCTRLLFCTLFRSIASFCFFPLVY